MKLTQKQIELLKLYDIEFQSSYEDVDSFNELLSNIDFKMTSYVDENDEPLKDFLVLQRLYDELFMEFEVE